MGVGFSVANLAIDSILAELRLRYEKNLNSSVRHMTSSLTIAVPQDAQGPRHQLARRLPHIRQARPAALLPPIRHSPRKYVTHQ